MRKLCLSLLFCALWPFVAFAQATVFPITGTIQDNTGRVVAGTTVIILSGTTLTVNTTTQPGSPLATIYSDPAGLDPINQTTNQAKTDGHGNFVVYTTAGLYVVQAYLRNGQQYVWPISVQGPNGIAITTVHGLSGYATKGNIAAVTDGQSSLDCTVGGGSTVVTCQYSGSAWAAIAGAGGSPGGGNMAVQYNNLGGFAGNSAAFSFNPSTYALNVFGLGTFGGLAVPSSATYASGSTVSLKPAASDARQYVNPTTGNDSNDGLSLGSPKATIGAAQLGLVTTGSLQGGTIYLAGNNTYVLTQELQVGNGTSSNVLIVPAGRIIIQCNITSGSDCIDIFPGSGFKCLIGFVNNCAIDTYNSSTNVASLVATDPTVQSQGIFMDGLDVRDTHNATIGTALVDFTNAYDASIKQLYVAAGANEKGLYIHDASSTICPNADHFYGIQLSGGFNTGSQPLVIKQDLGCNIGTLDFEGWDISHPGSGQRNITLDGNGKTFGIFGIYFSGGYEEDANANIGSPAMNLIKDTTGVTFNNVNGVRLNGSASEPLFELENTTGQGAFKASAAFMNGGTGHNFLVNDDLSALMNTDNLAGSYSYAGNTPGYGLSYSSALVSILANPATAGFLRMANSDLEEWRNVAGTGNDTFGLCSGTDNPCWNGAPFSGGTSVNVNGSAVSSPNFNGTLPAAPGGNVNVTFQVSGSSVSAYVPTSTASLTATYVGYGGGANTLTGDSGMTYVVGTHAMTLTGQMTAASFACTGSSAGCANWTLGNGSQTNASYMQIDSGSGASNTTPAYLALGASPADTYFSYFYPCLAAGNFCESSTTPAADSSRTIAVHGGYNPQSGAYTIANTDGDGNTALTGASNESWPLPCPSGTSFPNGWTDTLEQGSTGTLTVTTSGCSILANGSLVTSLSVPTTGVKITSTGSATGTAYVAVFNSTGGGVTCWNGDGIIFNNSCSTGSVTPTYANASAYTVFGRNAGTSGSPSYFTPTLASALFANQGTTTTVLHGNASGNPSWGAVSLATDVTGTLPIASLQYDAVTVNQVTCTLGSSCTPTGNTVTYTTSQVASTADNGKLVQMNCSSTCSYTLPGTQPATSWYADVVTIGSTNAGIVLGGSDTYNGGSSVPVLNKFRPMRVYANTATSTDYDGDAPLVASSNITFTPAANGMTVAAAGGGGGDVVYTSSQTASAADNGKLVKMNCSSACSYTLPNPEPSSTWYTHVISIGNTNATLALSSGATLYGQSTYIPGIQANTPLGIVANSTTSTDYSYTGLPRYDNFGAGNVGGADINVGSSATEILTSGTSLKIAIPGANYDLCTTGQIEFTYSGATAGVVSILVGKSSSSPTVAMSATLEASGTNSPLIVPFTSCQYIPAGPSIGTTETIDAWAETTLTGVVAKHIDSTVSSSTGATYMNSTLNVTW